MLLKDKVVMISGIGPGLGIKLARIAAEEGARGLVLAARSAGKLAEAKGLLASLNPECEVLCVPTDICDVAQCERLVRSALETFGRVDGLVNSAYYHGKFEAIETADLGEWRKTVETNLIGTMQLTQAVVPAMKAQGGGAMVMINTQATRQPVVLDIGGESGYAASKGALATAVKYLARELGPCGIRVNSAHMGWMWGAPVQGYVRHTAAEQGIPEEQIVAGIARSIALGRIPTDDDCARSALFLVSDYAAAVTGATLDVNGGDYMAP